MEECPLFGMALKHAARAISAWHVGVRDMHDLVLGNFMHPHCLLIPKTLLALGARPVFLNMGQAHFKAHRSQGILLEPLQLR